MLANSLIFGLITYTITIVYNLLHRRSLDRVFFIGIRILFFATLMVFFIQLSFYLIIKYKEAEINDEINSESDNSPKNNLDSEAESKVKNKQQNNSAVENEFADGGDFSALEPEEIK